MNDTEKTALSKNELMQDLDRLTAELEAAKADNAKQSEALEHANGVARSLMDMLGQKCLPSQLPRFIGEKIQGLQADNARLAAVLLKAQTVAKSDLSFEDRLQKLMQLALTEPQNSTALRDLLRPTVELLKDGVLSWEGEGPAISRARFKEELARLRAVMGEKP